MKLQFPTRRKFQYLLLTVVPLLVVACAHVETVSLSATEITNALAGNTIVHLDKRNGFKWYFGEDGKQVFDPDLGYPITGQWNVLSSTQELCWWDLDPNLPTCAFIKLGGDQIEMDFGDESFTHQLLPGNQVDLTDNPGRYFDPSRELNLQGLFDVIIESPPESLPKELSDISGAWYGNWYAYGEFAIIVEEINHQTAKLVYAWRSKKLNDSDNADWRSRTGYVEGNSLRFNFGDGSLNISVGSDGTMDVIWRSKDEGLRAIATRWPDPPWEALSSEKLDASNLSAEQHRTKIESEIAEIYSDYSKEIQQFFVEEALKAGVKTIRAMKPSDVFKPTMKFQAAGCAYGYWRRKLVIIEVNQPRCLNLNHLAHEISHVGSKCHGHDRQFYKYNYAVARRYEKHIPNGNQRRWFAPVQDVGSVEDIYKNKEC